MARPPTQITATIMSVPFSIERLGWAPRWPKGLSIAKIPLPEPAPKRLVGVVRLIASPRTPGVNAFLNACHKCVVGKAPQ